MPDIVWRRTGSSTEDSDEDNKQCSADLVEAAMVLLEDPTLAGATKPAEQQQQQQSVGALAAKDWDAFVGKCTAVKPRAVASSRLLAMRNAVPSPSARMVFQSQVGPSLCKLGELSALHMHGSLCNACISIHLLSKDFCICSSCSS